MSNNTNTYTDIILNNKNIYEENNMHIKHKSFQKICTNCGKMGHDYKHCNEPTTSWGIILVNIPLINAEHTSIDFNAKQINSVEINTNDDMKKLGPSANSIQFLMVSRKHSLGFVEFLRGRYKPDNINGIVFMFQQMMQNEINTIGTSTFDELWDNFWLSDSKKQHYKKEYIDSKSKFNQLKEKKDVEISLHFYVNNIKSQFNTPEWGFPKGRKIKGESNIECAVREFSEETNIDKNNIKIIHNIKPIVENITGTNGINYKHVYYIAEFEKNYLETNPCTNDFQNSEIGSVGFFTYDNAVSLIREYHIEKKKILTNVFMYYMNLLLHYDKNNDTNSI